MPTVQGTDVFDHAITLAYYQGVGGHLWGTPSAVQSPLYQSQANALKIVGNATTSEGVRRQITGSPTKGWVGFAFRLETLPTSNDMRIITLEDIAGTEVRYAVGTTGNLYAYITGADGTSYNYSGNPLSADTWYWSELIFDVNDGTGVKKAYWRLGPSGGTIADQTTLTVTAAASTMGTHYLMSASGGGVADWYTGIWKWGSAASVSDWLGEPTDLTLDTCLPDADITTTGWTTTPLFSKVNDASDATVIQATAS